MTLQTKTDGIEYLMALVQAQFDPDTAEPPLPGAATNRGEDIPKTVQQLRRQMAKRLAEKVKQEFRPDASGLFVLTETQAGTLGTLGLPPEVSSQVLSLNWLREAPGNHAVNCRLETIASMPPAAECGRPDWKRWWLDHAPSRIGVHRPQDHDPLKDPVSEMLNQVIRAMAETAGPEIPSHGDMARHMLKNGIPDTLNNRLVRPAKGRLDLTQVWIMGTRVRELAQRMGLSGEKHAARRPESPEALKAELEEQGITVRQDMGTITGLEELRQTLREAGIGEIYANARKGWWHDRKARDSHMLDHRGYRNGEQNQIYLREGEDPEKLMTRTEWYLMALTAPEHPGAEEEPIHSPDSAAASIGFMNRVSPKAAREYLDGRSEDPHPPTPDPCPRAAGCPSWCGRLQETGEFPFPLTHDGQYESCRYWQFLEKYGALEPSQRTEFARVAADAERNGRKRRQREQAQGQAQVDMDTAEEGMGAVTERAEKNEKKTQEKPEESRQAALF